MPFYVFSCECGALKSVYSHRADGGGEHWCDGEGLGLEIRGARVVHEPRAMTRDYMAESRRHIPSSAFPQVVKHIDGTPREYSSDAELVADAKRHGLIRRDDAAYEEQEWVQIVDHEHPREYTTVVNGEEIRVSKPAIRSVMKEGSGMGTKRSWVGVPKLATASKEEVEEFYRGR